MAYITVSRSVIVQADCIRRPWIIRDPEVIDGKDFLKITATDTGFCRFITGNTKRSALRKFPFLETLKGERKKAIKKDAGGRIDGSCSRYKLDQAKKRQNYEVASSSIPITLPAVSWGGDEMGPTTVNIKRPSHQNEVEI